jgi:hypothetical protein
LARAHSTALAGQRASFHNNKQTTKESKQRMKILDIPQSGKRGLNVSQAGQFGQISRALAIPSNPRTQA